MASDYGPTNMDDDAYDYNKSHYDYDEYDNDEEYDDYASCYNDTDDDDNYIASSRDHQDVTINDNKENNNTTFDRNDSNNNASNNKEPIAHNNTTTCATKHQAGREKALESKPDQISGGDLDDHTSKTTPEQISDGDLDLGTAAIGFLPHFAFYLTVEPITCLWPQWTSMMHILSNIWLLNLPLSRGSTTIPTHLQETSGVIQLKRSKQRWNGRVPLFMGLQKKLQTYWQWKSQMNYMIFYGETCLEQRQEGWQDVVEQYSQQEGC